MLKGVRCIGDLWAICGDTHSNIGLMVTYSSAKQNTNAFLKPVDTLTKFFPFGFLCFSAEPEPELQ